MSIETSADHTVLLAAGILASLILVGTDVVAGRMWKGYSFVSQSISELVASGAPTRSLVLPLNLAYGVLMIAFAVGIWQVAGGNLLIRLVSILIAGNAVMGSLVSLFIPMRISPEAIPSASTIHVVVMAIGLFLWLLAMVLAGVAYSNWFRYYSFGTLLAYLVLAIPRFVLPAPKAAGAPIATVGVQERTMVLGYLLWVAALAVLNLVGKSA